MTTTYATIADLTITLASLADGAIRSALEVDNETTRYDDAFVTGKVKLDATGVGTDGELRLYVYGGDADYLTDAAAGTDSVHATLGNLILVDVLEANANGEESQFAFGIAQFFGGILPRRWGIMIGNETGAALDSTPVNHDVQFSGITRS